MGENKLSQPAAAWLGRNGARMRNGEIMGKWRENEEMERVRKWRENEEIKRE